MRNMIYSGLVVIGFIGGWMATQSRFNTLADEEMKPQSPALPQPAIDRPAEEKVVQAREVEPDSEVLNEADIGELSDAYIEELGVIPFDRNMVLSQQAIDMLGLSGAQVEAITKQIADLKSTIEQLELDHREVIHPEGGNKVIVIHPFREEGERLWKERENQITAIVGSEKSRVLWHHGRDTIRDRLRHFGAGEQRMEFSEDKRGRTQAMHRAGNRMSVVFVGPGIDPIEELRHIVEGEPNEDQEDR